MRIRNNSFSGVRPFLLSSLFILITFISLNSFIQKSGKQDDEGKKLFTAYCSSCHMLPEPASLTKSIWKNHVLPIMAARMGIIYPNYDPFSGLSQEEKDIVKKNNIIFDGPVLEEDKWKKLVQYILANAPDSVCLDSTRLKRDSPLTQFVREDIQVEAEGPSLITGLKYNYETNTLWIGNFFNQVFTWKYNTGVTKTIKANSPVVDFNFYHCSTYFTEIGKLYPTELSIGDYARYNDTIVSPLLTPLHRPVHAEIEDLNNDNTPEIVMCNFGNKIGTLSLYKKNKSGKYTEQVLLKLPGAIKCFIRDMDGDGKKDILAMFSQGDESVYIFYQNGDLDFKAKRVLRFPPNYGTTDMALVDYNHDGLMDIITVHGDNADYSNILKAYHGIRININQGAGTFKEKFFYPIYGATRVVAEDFDKDGDIDFAVSSFFPDFTRLVDESFIYLENKDETKFSFKPYTLKSDVPLKTLTLEKADIDGDGDTDIIAGNFAQSPGAVPPNLDGKWKAAKYGIIIFKNQLYNPGR
ncbi:VCBS repeat-containing protein [Mucilaginibacter sp. L3T2-6]|uniref:FG-GAP repeat domain-containing protein n=1 Tax=Mucilaginibacter sp. L3T2-6 TaxID=3062491 RepID=UPI00270B291F|nr:VCBS repeat-containing protein [Mucilaginibacter sp. L3T2-6]MDO3643613.1 VCBS repeat-containing protein [Mucilaginibacter sp. L3T2-6]MDV6216139.1 VCBS repeat-containing protein [Mucilaginibacter sp. L3T2-6]